jgi:phosphate transport system substrate-binding protein
VAEAVADNTYAIGYLNAVEAARAELAVVLLQNAAGSFVPPNQSAVQAAAASATWERARDYEQLLVNAPGIESYPLVAIVYGLFPASDANTRALAFFDWTLSAGRTHAERLGYTPIPVDLASMIRAELGKISD